MEKRRSNSEKTAMHETEFVLRQLNIKMNTRAYMFLLDIIDIAKSEPNTDIKDIIEFLQKNRHYVGISPYVDEETIGPKNSFLPAVRRTIESAIENGNEEDLAKLKLDKLKSILDGKNSEEELIEEIGEKYRVYEYDERILVYFVRKIVEAT